MYFIGKKAFLIPLISAFCFTLLLSSCATNYPKNSPFVFENKITVKGNITKDEQKRLVVNLNNYWDDSLKALRTQQFGFFFKLKNPPLFDTANIIRSKNFMTAYLNSQGYYYPKFKSKYFYTHKKKEIRTTISFDINTGSCIKIDTISYNIIDTTNSPIDSTLQILTNAEINHSLLKKGIPYTKDAINNELDRLINIYHQHGYVKFTRDGLYALIDTLDHNMLLLTLDPIKQAELIAEADKKRKETPKWGIAIMQREGMDSSFRQQFHVGHLYYYPEIKDPYYNPDSVIKSTDYSVTNFKEMTMYYTDGLFGFKPLREHTYFRNKEVYNEDLYYKSINRLSQIGAWKQVDIKPVFRGKDSVDLYIFMVPEKKQGITIDQELSRNTGDIGSGNLLGIATNFSYKNRNIWKQAIQSLTTLRFGVELNLDKQLNSTSSNSILQTSQVSLSHTYSFPRIIQPFKNWHALSKLDNKRTLFTLAGSYVDRKDLYKLNSITANWGYQWSKGNNTWLFKPINIELYKVDSLSGLDTLFKTNPFLRNSFKNGKVAGISLSYSKTFISKKDPTKSHYFRLGYEESGFLINQFTNVANNVFEYNKIEGEYRYLKRYTKTEFASRLFTGVGLPIGTQTLPVFKQYFLGGPNSMRAWGLRQLGLGSSLASDTITNGYTDRFGDFTIEANLEYRFPVATFNGVKVGSAIYSDIGNIWNIKKQVDDPSATFSLNNLQKDLAVGVGTGVRVDFSYFLIRVDFAYKLKDPARLENNGWMKPSTFEWTSTRTNGTRVKNFGVQLGIGLPF